MPKVNTAKTAFTMGEIGTRGQDRTDVDSYAQGAERLENVIVDPAGGCFTRPGTEFFALTREGVSHTNPGTTPSRLIPFVVSGNIRYLIEVSLNSITVYNLDGTVNTASDTVVHNQEPYRYYANLGDLALVKFFPVNASDIPLAQYAQSVDKLWLTWPNRMPVVIQRTSFAGSGDFLIYSLWAAAQGSLEVGVPFKDIISSGATMTLSGTPLVAAEYGITCSNVNWVFALGQYYKINQGSTTGLFQVIQVYGPGSARVVCLVTNGSAAASQYWNESAWDSKNGFPKAVCVYQSRLVFANTSSQPDTFWASQLGDMTSFQQERFLQDPGHWSSPKDLGFAYTDPFSNTIASDQLNEIQWMSAGKTISVGTTLSEYVVGPNPNGDGSFSAISVSLSLETTFGSTAVQAVRSGYSVNHVARGGKHVRELTFDFNSQSYTSDDLSVLADHLAQKIRNRYPTYPWLDLTLSPDQRGGGQIIGLCKISNPFTVVFGYTNDGALLSLTRDKSIRVNAWTYLEMGGSLTVSGSTRAPQVVSICSIPDTKSVSDSVYMVVRRTLNGAESYTIERMNLAAEFTTGQSGLNGNEVFPYLDCYKSFNGTTVTSTNVLNGFTWLKNTPAHVFYNNGTEFGTATVSNTGTITLTGATPATSTSSFHYAGLDYGSTIKTLRQEGGSAIGSSQGSIRRLDRVAMRFHKTQAAYFNTSDGTAEEVTELYGSTPQGQPINPVTMEVVRAATGGYDTSAQVTVTNRPGFAMGLTSIILRGVESDG